MAEIAPVFGANQTPAEWGLHFQRGEVLAYVRNPVSGRDRPGDQEGVGVALDPRDLKVAQNGSQGEPRHVLRGASSPRGKHRGRRVKRAWRTFTLRSRGQRVRQEA